jgi:integrase
MITGSPQITHKLYYACLNTYPNGKEGGRKTKWIPTGFPERGGKRKAEATTDMLKTIFNRDGTLISKYSNALKPIEKVSYDFPDLPEVTLQSLREMLGVTEKQSNPDLERAVLSAADSSTAGSESPEAIRDMLFCDYMVQWLERLESSIERNTYGGYKIIVHGRIFEYFNSLSVTVGNLKSGHIEDYYRQLNKQGLSANSMLHHHSNIRKALQTLYKKQIIPNNPADLIDNRPKRTKYMAGYYDADELNEYLKIVKDTKMELPVLLAGFYGFRRSEAMGLKHSAIDFKRCILTVQHVITTTNIDNKIIVERKDRTKSKSSFRTMRLVDVLEDAILRAREHQEHYKRKLGSLYCTKDRDYLCLDEYGRLLDPGYVTARHKELLEIHGLRHIRYHDLRHSCASILLSQGIPLVQIMKWLGHSNIQTTMRYIHFEEDKAMNETANKMSGVIKLN